VDKCKCDKCTKYEDCKIKARAEKEGNEVIKCVDFRMRLECNTCINYNNGVCSNMHGENYGHITEAVEDFFCVNWELRR